MLRVVFCFLFFLGCTVASRGGYQMARGRHYAKLSLSNAARLSFSDLCILLLMFLSLCRLCVCVFLCSHWSLVDVPLIFFCPADHVPDWQPRVLLGMVEARSVNVKKTTTTTDYISRENKGLQPKLDQKPSSHDEVGRTCPSAAVNRLYLMTAGLTCPQPHRTKS